MANKDTLQSMLQKDALVFQNLIKQKTIIDTYKVKTAAFRSGDRSVFKRTSDYTYFIVRFNFMIRSFNKRQKSYVERQKDYRRNPSFFEKANDNVTRFFHNFYAKLTGSNGLGAAPLLIAFIPLVLKIGAAVGITAIISNYVSKYFTSTNVDYTGSLAEITKLAELNPQLAQKALDELADAQKEQSKGFFDSLGTGAKWGLGLAGGALAFGVAYKVGEEKDWWKNK